MKQADIDRIMATAEANAKKDTNRNADPFAAAAAAAAAAKAAESGQIPEDQGRRGGGGRGADSGGRGSDNQGRGPGGGRGNMSDADRQKMSELRQKMQAASPEDREKLQKQMQELMAKAGITPGRGGRDGGRGDGPGAPGSAGRGPGGGPSDGRGAPDGMDAIAVALRRGVGQYSDDDRKNAKLPLPPEQDSQAQVLLRPGLLADVEIQVEKLSDVIHVPAQAVFQKNGQYLVYVQKKGKYEPRPVQLVKQSESMMVIASGVQPGEVVAMADPTADKKKNGEKKSQGGNPMGGMPGGK